MAKRLGWSQLSETTRQRYEKAGVTRAEYEAGASLAKARRVTPEKERAQKREKTARAQRDAVDRAREWSKKHANTGRMKFTVPKGEEFPETVKRARAYNRMVAEVEKGWRPIGERTPADTKPINDYFKKYAPKVPLPSGAEEFVSLSPKRGKRR